MYRVYIWDWSFECDFLSFGGTKEECICFIEDNHLSICRLEGTNYYCE